MTCEPNSNHQNEPDGDCSISLKLLDELHQCLLMKLIHFCIFYLSYQYTTTVLIYFSLFSNTLLLSYNTLLFFYLYCSNPFSTKGFSPFNTLIHFFFYFLRVLFICLITKQFAHFYPFFVPSRTYPV